MAASSPPVPLPLPSHPALPAWGPEGYPSPARLRAPPPPLLDPLDRPATAPDCARPEPQLQSSQQRSSTPQGCAAMTACQQDAVPGWRHLASGVLLPQDLATGTRSLRRRGGAPATPGEARPVCSTAPSPL
eukprot:CAMPEP_0180814914 /NCGR_PEP_ID=MMETSP1038_2-20121128/67325_1 /TAXON_ID=632150 /ORGANISM="Azadinium spinosum, Strain 3D9" /LENGTH=130 /DNA_ID=CAMNT_0022856609 /DNA_START=319 /DNA_END=708 /DNA_ORIENTATION=+